MQTLKLKLLSVKSDDLIFVFIVLAFFLLSTGTAPPLIAAVIATLLWVFSGKIFHAKAIIRQSWFFPVIPFIVLPWIGLLYSQNPDLGLDYAIKTQYWIVLLVTAGISFDDRRMYILLKSFWAGLFIGALLALTQFAGVLPLIREGFPGFGVVHTYMCVYLIIGILTASFYFKQSKTWRKRALFLLLIFAYIFHLSVLKGRAGYLIFVILSPLIAHNLLHGFSVKIKIVVSIILAASLLFSPVVRTVIQDTFTKVSEQKEKLLAGEIVNEVPRPYIIHEAIRSILEHPLIGTGTGGLSVPTRAKGHMVEHPHNNFLYMGASFGVFGIAACFWLFWKMFALSFRSRQTAMGYFIFSVCIVLFLGGMFDTLLLNTDTLLFFTLSYGLMNHLGHPVH